MMPTIRIDEDVWRFLQSKAKPFEDSPNDVLRRELGLERSKGSAPGTSTTVDSGMARAELLLPNADYTNLSVSSFELNGKRFPARTFKEILIGVSEFLRREDPDRFDRVAITLHGKKRVYFSSDPKSLRSPFRIPQSNVFVETNLNANMIVAVCTTLVKLLGYDFNKFAVR
ncbi:MAG TPA: hypothetical protein VEI73_13410 [Candidatus Acidoferrum sp.]|nr:hypothetical protein [Candidatus Acidoferrum sp.]